VLVYMDWPFADAHRDRNNPIAHPTMSSDKQALLEMGFDEPHVDWALRATKNAGLQPALDFLVRAC